MLRLDVTAVDYAIIAAYFLVVLGIGAVARLSIKTDLDFFLSGRTLPAWITGLAFIAVMMPFYDGVNLFALALVMHLMLTIVGLHHVGGVSGLSDKVKSSNLGDAGLHAWQGLGSGRIRRAPAT